MTKRWTKKKRRCSIGCPPRMADGTVARPTLLNLCLLCWNTGWQIPIGSGTPTIDEWLAMHKDETPPDGHGSTPRPPGKQGR